MKKGKLVIVMIVVLVSGIVSVHGQSKKVRLAAASRLTDSLEKVLSAKNEGLVALEVKLAREEGIKDVHNEEIKRLETKADSLRELIIAKNMTIENQAAKIAQLNTDITTLQTQQKELTTQNESLTAELNILKPKTPETGLAVKDVKPTDPPKEEPKTGNLAAGTKPVPPAKN